MPAASSHWRRLKRRRQHMFLRPHLSMQMPHEVADRSGLNSAKCNDAMQQAAGKAQLSDELSPLKGPIPAKIPAKIMTPRQTENGCTGPHEILHHCRHQQWARSPDMINNSIHVTSTRPLQKNVSITAADHGLIFAVSCPVSIQERSSATERQRPCTWPVPQTHPLTDVTAT